MLRAAHRSAAVIARPVRRDSTTIDVTQSPWTLRNQSTTLAAMDDCSASSAAQHARQTFGLRLRELRRARGLSQESLAGLASLDRTYVSSCERGRRNISLENIYRLAAALGVEPSELLKQPSDDAARHTGA